MTAIAWGYLSLCLVCGQVAQTRLADPVGLPLTKDPAGYGCLLAVRNDLYFLVDQEVYVVTGTGVYGPYLVVDLEADVHAGQMKEAGLLADISCPRLVHKLVSLALRGPH